MFGSWVSAFQSKANKKEDGSATANAIPKERLRSPCTAVCTIDPISGYCEGCLRTLDEIGAWRFMEPEKKITVLDDLKNRQIPDHKPQSEKLNDALQ